MDKETGIYVFENRVEHKAYIGQSIRLERRIYEHCIKQKRYKDEFHLDLQKNPEYFIKNILEYCSEEELNEREIHWIELYKENGWKLYNKCNYPGGFYKRHKHFTMKPEIKKKLSDSIKGENHPWWGKHHSEETKRKLSDLKKGTAGYWKGKHLPDEVKKKLSEIRIKNGLSKGENNPMYGRRGKDNPNYGKHWRINTETGKREYY